MASLHEKQKETITKGAEKCVLGYKKVGYEKKVIPKVMNETYIKPN